MRWRLRAGALSRVTTMSAHKAEVSWYRNTESFAYDDYDRRHTWRFENGIEVSASAAPAFRGNEECVDPEEAFVVSLSACHMLTFLALASKKRFIVDSYRDQACGYLEKNARGKLSMTRVILKPQVEFGGDRQPGAEELSRLHERAHEECFIANSVHTEVRVETGE